MVEEDGVRKEYVKYDEEANTHRYIFLINYQIMKGKLRNEFIIYKRRSSKKEYLI